MRVKAIINQQAKKVSNELENRWLHSKHDITPPDSIRVDLTPESTPERNVTLEVT